MGAHKTYSIGEVSEIAGISPRTLRFYEEAGLLTPTRGPNGYRRYVSADIDHIEKGTHMDDKEKFEGMKREPVEDNERTYG